MTKLQKTGLYVAIISAVLWFIWLFVWLYSDFDKGDQVLAIPVEDLNTDGWLQYWMNYFVYYALISAFAVWILLILGECSRKSLKKALIVLVASCLLWWLFQSVFIWFLWSLCWWCEDYIAYALWLFFLLFFVLWFVSFFFAIEYLINSKKKAIIITLFVLCLVCILFVWFRSDYLLGYLRNSLKAISLLFLIVSIVICIMAWVRRYKEAKKSS